MTKKTRKKKTLKSKAWDWLSRKIRLQAVLETRKKYHWPVAELVECYTCGKIIYVVKSEAGHFESRGIGGSSGLYFDERAIRVQCGRCNGLQQGCHTEFRANLVKEYGEEIVQELERLHKLPARWRPRDYPGMILLWKAETEALLKETGLKRWW